eukprot:1115174-Prorocentrum_lima.AAC.1
MSARSAVRSPSPLVKTGPLPRIQLGRSRSQLAQRAKRPSPRLGTCRRCGRRRAPCKVRRLQRPPLENRAP